MFSFGVVGPKTADFFNQSLSDSDEYAYWVKNVMPYVKDQMGNVRTARLGDNCFSSFPDVKMVNR